MSRRRIPKYRHYKPKDLGLVVIDGRQHYLGRYGTAESLAEYNRIVQEWLARGPLPSAEPGAGDVALPHMRCHRSQPARWAPTRPTSSWISSTVR